jgi:[ribosomal protein S18]-alanine N-acetyltransferase
LETDVTADPFEAKRVSMLWAEPFHAAEIAALHAQLFDPPWDQPSIEKMLLHPASTALVARYGVPQITVGFVLAQLAADEAEILTIGVDKALQKHGIGLRLLESIARACKKVEAKRLFLEVADDNISAQKLYAKAGFLEVGRRKGYYHRGTSLPVDARALALML